MLSFNHSSISYILLIRFSFLYIAVKLLSNKLLLAGIVILGATAYALYQVAKAYDADANAAKGTADTVEKLTDRYNELTTEAEKFKSAVSDYKEAENGLDKLDK